MEKAKLIGKTYGIFFTRWLNDPLRTASVVPSGAALARLMARQVDPKRPGMVIELGAGTGAITTALLAAGVPAERLVLVERDPVLCRLLHERFPKLALIGDDALHLRARLAERGFQAAAIVLSSLPVVSMPKRQQRAIYDQVRELLDDEGAFIQYSYSPVCPVTKKTLDAWGWRAKAVGRAWLNLPPATVWRFTKKPAAEGER